MTKRSLPPLIEDPTQTELVRGLVQAGRDADVGGYDFEQGFRKHLALIASGAPVPPWADGLTHGTPSTAGTGAAPAAAAGSSLVGWLTGAALGVAVVSAAWFMYQHQEAAPATHAPEPAVVQAKPVVPAAPAAALPADANRLLPRVDALDPRPRAAYPGNARGKHADKHSFAQALAKPRSAEGAPGTAASGTAARPGTDAFAKPQAATEAVRPIASAQVEQEGAKRAEERPVVAAPAAQEAVAQEDGKLEREMAMLAMTQRVLVSDPQRALALARQGEAEFPGSMFTQERQQLLLLALVKLGKTDEARRLAKPYLHRYPTGPFSDRVRRSLAAGSVAR